MSSDDSSSGRGGKREGAGRPGRYGRGPTVPVRVPVGQVKQVRAWLAGEAVDLAQVPELVERVAVDLAAVRVLLAGEVEGSGAGKAEPPPEQGEAVTDAALDTLLIDVLAVADTLKRQQGGINKQAADGLRQAVREFGEVSDWDATEASERDRQRRRVTARVTVGAGESMMDAELAMLNQLAGRG